MTCAEGGRGQGASTLPSPARPTRAHPRVDEDRVVGPHRTRSGELGHRRLLPELVDDAHVAARRGDLVDAVVGAEGLLRRDREARRADGRPRRLEARRDEEQDVAGRDDEAGGDVDEEVKERLEEEVDGGVELVVAVARRERRPGLARDALAREALAVTAAVDHEHPGCLERPPGPAQATCGGVGGNYDERRGLQQRLVVAGCSRSTFDSRRSEQLLAGEERVEGRPATAYARVGRVGYRETQDIGGEPPRLLSRRELRFDGPSLQLGRRSNHDDGAEVAVRHVGGARLNTRRVRKKGRKFHRGSPKEVTLFKSSPESPKFRFGFSQLEPFITILLGAHLQTLGWVGQLLFSASSTTA